MLIVDAQVHIWKADAPDRPWTPGVEPQLPEPLGIEGLVEQMTGAGVDRVVIVPPVWEGMRNDYATEAFDRFPDRFRFMGRLDLERPGARAQLPGWMAQRGNLGMRQSFLSKHERDQFAGGAYDWLWEDAERYGVPVMAHAAGLRPTLETIATRRPNLKLILDHMGFSTSRAKAGSRKLRRTPRRLRAFPMSSSNFRRRRCIRASLIRSATCTLTSVASSTLSDPDAASGAPICRICCMSAAIATA
jgi:predicted TIM-barrel fold metal-dependent hydrolase